jgi:cell division protein FtsI (penicillin-binding protein 3)
MPERLNARTKTRPDQSRQRTSFVVLFIVLWMFAVGARLVYLQVFQHDSLSKRARQQQQATFEITGERGLILDRQGRELARSLEVDSFFAVPTEIDDPRAAAQALSPLVGVDAATLEARLSKAKDAKRAFIWLARELEPEQATAWKALNIKGVQSIKEPKRYYPNGALAAHVIGFVGLDDKGLAGVESFRNASLTGDGGWLTESRDARRTPFDSAEIDPKAGESITLTIDQNIQYQVERALLSALDSSRAKSGAAVVLDPHTGEILALANAPGFDPNTAKVVAPEVLANKALQYTYEPGSTFKVVAYSGAIEENLVKPTDKIDCQNGSITIYGRTIHDSHPHGVLTITEALAQSSNVAAIKLGMRLHEKGKLYDYIKRFGFGAKTGVELPGETRGLLRDVSKWDKTSIGSIPMGQEIGVTPVQVAAAFGTIANDGVRIAPHIIKEVRDEDGRIIAQPPAEQHAVVSRETARTIRSMLEMVTVDGTARAAQLDGYTAAGKTGTAQKIDPKTHAYSKTKYVASFVGFAPVENPAVVIIVVLDEPGTAIYGGTVAAPVFKEIAEQVLPYLGVAPDTDTKQSAPRAEDQIALAELNHAASKTNASESDSSESSENRVAPASLPVVVEGVREKGGVSEVVFAAAGDRALLMPDVRGRSVRDAARICAALGLELEARGEGRAVAQSPAAGAPIEAGRKVRITFARSD